MRTFIPLAIAIVATLAGAAALWAQEKPKDPEPMRARELPVDKVPLNGKTLPQWIADIKDKDPGVREMGIQAVVRFYSSAPNDMAKRLVRRMAAKRVINELGDSDPSIRANAAVALGLMGAEPDDAPACLRGLGDLLKDPQMIVRFRAATAIGGYGPYAKDLIPQLNMAMGDRLASWEVHKAVAFALGTTGMDPNLIIPRKPEPKGEKAEDDSKSDKPSMESKDGPNPIAVRSLTTALRNDPCADVRLEIVRSLLRFGKPPASAETQRAMIKRALQGASQDRDKSVAIWARVGLMGLDKPSAKLLNEIAHYLKSDHPAAVRTNAAWALATMGLDAKGHTDELIEALDDPEAEVVYYAVKALHQLGRLAQGAVPSLKKLAADKEKQVVRPAVDDALKTIAPEEAKAKPNKVETIK
jgi:HEAT repeat protein